MKVRFGIVGFGNQGSYYYRLFTEGRIENGEVTAVCDIDPAKMNGVTCTRFTEYQTLLDSGLVDAVLIETPHYLHPEIAEACFARNIHVLCDKPAGVYAGQVKRMNEAAKDSSVLFGMMFNQRTNALYRKMREIVASGGIGTLQRVTWIITDWYRTQYYYNTGSWRATWAGEGGGVLINQCPHQLDLLLWVVGETPKAVRGFCRYGKWHNIEVEDDVTAYLEYEGGATGVFVTTTGETPGTNRFEISGTKGKLLCENDKLFYCCNQTDSAVHTATAADGYTKPAFEVLEIATDGSNPQHIGILNNFANAVLGMEPLFVSGEEGLASVELMNAIEYSGWLDGERIELPTDEKAYYSELQRHMKM